MIAAAIRTVRDHLEAATTIARLESDSGVSP